MNVTQAIERIFDRYLPSPFSLALLLTLFTFILCLIFTAPKSTPLIDYSIELIQNWEQGLWNNNLLVFSYQMMLILVLGHILVLSKPVERFINLISDIPNDTAQAAVLVAFTTMIVAFFNWGLGLVYGALITRSIGERFQRNHIPLNYPLVGAAGYSGLLVWHGGISGSAPIKINEKGHLASIIENDQIKELVPEAIYFSQTVLSSSNLIVFFIVLMSISLLLYFLGGTQKATFYRLSTTDEDLKEDDTAHFFDRSRVLPLLVSAIIFGAVIINYGDDILKLAITPNLINLVLLGLGLFFHGNIISFSRAVRRAIGDVSGILIQFPIYFGIMALMNSSGLVNQISDLFIHFSSSSTLPIFTFISAGIVNVFVPSGGGQWVVQGPIAIEAAINLGVPLPKIIMSIAYGDQLTNMMQPFWALPLLAITKIKAKELLPYTLLMMIVAGAIYLMGLLFLY